MPLATSRPRILQCLNHRFSSRTQQIRSTSTAPFNNPSTSTPTPSPRLRHTVITGGSRGIGLAIAQLFASHNHRITLISRSSAALQSAVLTLPSPQTEKTTPAPHRYIAGDVSQPSFWEDIVSHSPSTSTSSTEAQEQHAPKKDTIDGNVDVLIHCAGLSQFTLLPHTAPASINTIISTNLLGPIYGTRALVKARKLRKRKDDAALSSPVVINMGSLLGVKGGRGAAAYAASKAGLLGLTRALALELGRLGIRVNAIVPGYIETDMTRDLSHPSLLSQIPLSRLGQPFEIADAAWFLATNQYANNCVINLDGGLSAT